MDQTLSASTCHRCQRTLTDRMSFVVRLSGQQEVLMCLMCALRQAPMLRRSAAIALIVGTLLIVINQADVIFGGHASTALIWKIPLTVMVPFVVATLGALTNSRRTIPREEHEVRRA